MAESLSEPPVVDAIVDGDGNAVILAAQLPERFPAGTHVRVRVEQVAAERRSIEGALPDLPELTWDDFEAASQLAAQDAELGRQAS